jgi:hypothetical protein
MAQTYGMAMGNHGNMGCGLMKPKGDTSCLIYHR